jgi:predicted transposase YbfD/YdcC
VPTSTTYTPFDAFAKPGCSPLNRCFGRVETLITKTGGEIIPIDGKRIRGSYDRNQGKSALHLITALSSEQRRVLAQIKVDDKSNELTAIPALLELLDITDSIITIDAMGTQTEIAQKIIEKKGNYVLTLKANHPTLHHQFKEWFERASAQQFSGIDVSYEQRIESVIIVERSVKFGRCQLQSLVSFTNRDYGRG